MTLLIAGLLIFFIPHSVRLFADGWRAERIARMGLNPWKAAYSVVSIAGFVAMVWGYGLARQANVELWSPPAWTHGITSILTLPALILLAASKVPGTRIKAVVGHPMLVGTKTWAAAHLVSNGRVEDVLLFGAFLLWSALAYRAARARDRAAGTTYPPKGPARDVAAIAVGVALWLAFALYLHQALIGVRPF